MSRFINRDTVEAGMSLVDKRVLGSVVSRGVVKGDLVYIQRVGGSWVSVSVTRDSSGTVALSQWREMPGARLWVAKVRRVRVDKLGRKR